MMDYDWAMKIAITLPNYGMEQHCEAIAVQLRKAKAAGLMEAAALADRWRPQVEGIKRGGALDALSQEIQSMARKQVALDTL